MTNPLTMKLEQFTRFDAAERERLDKLLTYPARRFARGEIILQDGLSVDHIILVKDGLAGRSKTMLDGNRQTMAFLVPGDLCDVEVFVLDAMDHDIIALTDTTCILIPEDEIKELLTQSSNLTRALWWSTMTDSAVLRERIIDHGSRDAREQIAHIFCELLIRYRMVGQAQDNALSFPLTQEDLAEATGLTPVHVNRVIQQLRLANLVEWRGKVLTIPDPKRLMEAAQFSSCYLHLTRTQEGDDEVSGRVGDLIR